MQPVFTCHLIILKSSGQTIYTSNVKHSSPHPHFSPSCASPAAQQGEALLWSSWLEKHPQTAEGPGSVTAPWDDPDTKALWDEHSTETNYSYWEQYSYWAAQGWSVDQSVCNGNTAEEAVAVGVMGRGVETQSEEWLHGQTRAESQQSEEVQTLHDGVEVVNDQFGQKCTLETGGSTVTDSETDKQCVTVADDPSDGGTDRKRPAASSQPNTAEHAGDNCV